MSPENPVTIICPTDRWSALPDKLTWVGKNRETNRLKQPKTKIVPTIKSNDDFRTVPTLEL